MLIFHEFLVIPVFGMDYNILKNRTKREFDQMSSSVDLLDNNSTMIGKEITINRTVIDNSKPNLLNKLQWPNSSNEIEEDFNLIVKQS